MKSIEDVLTAFLRENHDPVEGFRDLFSALRPHHPDSVLEAAESWRVLVTFLRERSDLSSALRQSLVNTFSSRRAVLLLATSGIYPETGLVTETRRRISHKWLPDSDDNTQLGIFVSRIVHSDDARWLSLLPLSAWVEMMETLGFLPEREGYGTSRLFMDYLKAVRVVAHRVAAAGLDPEILRILPDLENHASPFLALCEEVLAEVNRMTALLESERILLDFDDRHTLVLLEQSRNTIQQVRRKAQNLGASLSLTFRLRRLMQHLDRLELLVGIASAMAKRDSLVFTERTAEFSREIVLSVCRQNDLRSFWRENLELVALRVTENAGKSGEHYITESRDEYFSMLKSAAGGGFVIALMAAVKVMLGSLGLPPLTEVLVVALNYGLGFVFIHILHFTVATKQPAMTANAIAAVIGSVEDGKKSSQRDFHPLVTLIAKTVRTQLVAILGNIGLAIPVAMMISYLLFLFSGNHFLASEKAVQLLADIHPLRSGALVYAAMAGVCLFLAGLIAGYYDNLCAYNRIPDRLLQLRWPGKLFGDSNWRSVTEYLGNNLGALAGNFFFGFLLGGVSGIGVLLGLPLDIRHIAFASANWGYSLEALEFALDWKTILATATGVLLIGLINLSVSFYLALWVALKSRGIGITQRGEIIRSVRERMVSHPRDFFFPPVK